MIGGLNDLRAAQFAVTAGKVILPRMGKSMPEKVLTFAEHAYKDSLSKINEVIAGKTYAVGDALTIVDFLFAEMIMNAALIKTNYEGDYPNIQAYYQGLLTNVPALKEDSENVKDIIEMLAGN